MNNGPPLIERWMQSVWLVLSRVPPRVDVGAARAETAAASIALLLSVSASATAARRIAAAIAVELLLQLEWRHWAALAAAGPAAPGRGQAPGRVFRPAQDRRPLGVGVFAEQSAQLLADVILNFLVETKTAVTQRVL